MTSIGAAPTALPQPGSARRPWSRDPLTYWFGGIVIVLLTVLVVLPAVTSASATALGVAAPLQPPSAEHLFGTDQLGRDVAARVLYGARLSMLVAFSSALVALLVGGLLGAVAATGPRWLSECIMRLTDIGLAFPGILLAIVLAAVIGPELSTTVIVLGVIFAPPMVRVVRGAILSEYGEDYVTAARVLGSPRWRIVGYHAGLNAALPILVFTTVVMAEAIAAEAALSFIGAGIKPPAPSWGNIVRDGYSIVHAGAWWVSVFPGIAIVLSVLGLNRFSEALGRRVGLR
jgi:ABC-type dipeptide/oligopeptide/nickel transport system permease subunit